ncbi:MAG: intradiol ring-cleavage dioxygenase, partial [Mucilaginibacter polytrichastri]|nr:intradiol ring-cleavage dioxygenase [Mucilaginibacter polytrichastri]
MERKSFLKSLMIGAMSTPVLLDACKKDSTTSSSTGTTTTATGGSTGSTCTVAPTETEGPFPTKSQASYVRSDITDGRTGYKLTVNITIKNASASCAVLANAIVDIWHCDKDGNYS